MLGAVLLLDPQQFAFMSPFLFVVVASGLRFRDASHALSWAARSLGALLLLTGSFWRERIELPFLSTCCLRSHLRDLLTLAKGEAGRLELRPEPIDACALVESVAASAADLARESSSICASTHPTKRCS